jgi:hypothetical protein
MNIEVAVPGLPMVNCRNEKIAMLITKCFVQFSEAGEL